MDFFAHQDVARRKTGLLITYFGLAVVMIIVSVYAAFTAVFIGAQTQGEGEIDLSVLWNPEVFFAVAGATALVILSGSLYKIAALRGGGEAVALQLGGRRIDPNSRDRDERRVLNVVEEMAIAAGTPVPPVFLIDESGINAFAAGSTVSNAAIGVTRGCVQELTRDELQGVMAHEFSHILNGDMRINIRLMGVLNGILIIGIIGYYIFRSTLGTGHRRRRSKEGNNTLPIVIFGLVVMAVGYIGVFFGKLIKSAVSRQREFLADASAVQFTRNPDGIAGALKRIGGFSSGSRIENKKAEEVSHMFFANGLKASFMDGMATHPPLAERISRIDPGFDGSMDDEPRRTSRRGGDDRARGFAGASPAVSGADTVTVSAAQIMDSVGAPAPEHVEHAHAIHQGLPAAVLDAAHEPFGARAVMYGILLSTDVGVRERQMERLKTMADAAVVTELERLMPDMDALDSSARIPLVDITIPALRMLSPGQYNSFAGNLRFLKEADDQIDLFEYCVQRILMRHLAPAFEAATAPKKRIKGLREAAGHARVLVSSIALFGADDSAEVEASYAAGAAKFPPGILGEIATADTCTLQTVDDALSALEHATPQLRKITLGACVAAVTRDGEITSVEAELLRAIADGLACPMPPILAN